MDIETLIADWIRLTNLMHECNDGIGRIEMEITQTMERDGATAIPHDFFNIELKKTFSYDESKLASLRELISPQELEDAGAYIPEHILSSTVPARWNMTKTKPFGRYGAEVRDVISSAAYVRSTKLVITERE
jgi:hypothetical protein